MKSSSRFTSFFLASAVALLLAFAASLPRVRAAEAKAPEAPSPYAILESFVGGTWTGAIPPQKDAPPMHIEMHFTKNDNGQGIRTQATWFVGDKPAPYTNGLYVWDPAKKSFLLVYTDRGGALTQGLMTVAGNVLVHDLVSSSPDGTSEHVRARITKVDPNTFINAIYLEKNGEWQKFVEVKYERKS